MAAAGSALDPQLDPGQLALEKLSKEIDAAFSLALEKQNKPEETIQKLLSAIKLSKENIIKQGVPCKTCKELPIEVCAKIFDGGKYNDLLKNFFLSIGDIKVDKAQLREIISFFLPEIYTQFLRNSKNSCDETIKLFRLGFQYGPAYLQPIFLEDLPGLLTKYNEDDASKLIYFALKLSDKDFLKKALQKLSEHPAKIIKIIDDYYKKNPGHLTPEEFGFFVQFFSDGEIKKSFLGKEFIENCNKREGDNRQKGCKIAFTLLQFGSSELQKKVLEQIDERFSFYLTERYDAWHTGSSIHHVEQLVAIHRLLKPENIVNDIKNFCKKGFKDRSAARGDLKNKDGMDGLLVYAELLKNVLVDIFFTEVLKTGETKSSSATAAATSKAEDFKISRGEVYTFVNNAPAIFKGTWEQIMKDKFLHAFQNDYKRVDDLIKLFDGTISNDGLYKWILDIWFEAATPSLDDLVVLFQKLADKRWFLNYLNNKDSKIVSNLNLEKIIAIFTKLQPKSKSAAAASSSKSKNKFAELIDSCGNNENYLKLLTCILNNETVLANLQLEFHDKDGLIVISKEKAILDFLEFFTAFINKAETKQISCENLKKVQEKILIEYYDAFFKNKNFKCLDIISKLINTDYLYDANEERLGVDRAIYGRRIIECLKKDFDGFCKFFNEAIKEIATNHAATSKSAVINCLTFLITCARNLVVRTPDSEMDQLALLGQYVTLLFAPDETAASSSSTESEFFTSLNKSQLSPENLVKLFNIAVKFNAPEAKQKDLFEIIISSNNNPSFLELFQNPFEVTASSSEDRETNAINNIAKFLSKIYKINSSEPNSILAFKRIIQIFLEKLQDVKNQNIQNLKILGLALLQYILQSKELIKVFYNDELIGAIIAISNKIGFALEKPEFASFSPGSYNLFKIFQMAKNGFYFGNLTSDQYGAIKTKIKESIAGLTVQDPGQQSNLELVKAFAIRQVFGCSTSQDSKICLGIASQLAVGKLSFAQLLQEELLQLNLFLQIYLESKDCYHLAYNNIFIKNVLIVGVDKLAEFAGKIVPILRTNIDLIKNLAVNIKAINNQELNAAFSGFLCELIYSIPDVATLKLLLQDNNIVDYILGNLDSLKLLIHKGFVLGLSKDIDPSIADAKTKIFSTITSDKNLLLELLDKYANLASGELGDILKIPGIKENIAKLSDEEFTKLWRYLIEKNKTSILVLDDDIRNRIIKKPSDLIFIDHASGKYHDYLTPFVLECFRNSIPIGSLTGITGTALYHKIILENLLFGLTGKIIGIDNSININNYMLIRHALLADNQFSIEIFEFNIIASLNDVDQKHFMQMWFMSLFKGYTSFKDDSAKKNSTSKVESKADAVAASSSFSESSDIELLCVLTDNAMKKTIAEGKVWALTFIAMLFDDKLFLDNKGSFYNYCVSSGLNYYLDSDKVTKLIKIFDVLKIYLPEKEKIINEIRDYLCMHTSYVSNTRIGKFFTNLLKIEDGDAEKKLSDSVGFNKKAVDSLKEDLINGKKISSKEDYNNIIIGGASESSAAAVPIPARLTAGPSIIRDIPREIFDAVKALREARAKALLQDQPILISLPEVSPSTFAAKTPHVTPEKPGSRQTQRLPSGKASTQITPEKYQADVGAPQNQLFQSPQPDPPRSLLLKRQESFPGLTAAAPLLASSLVGFQAGTGTPMTPSASAGKDARPKSELQVSALGVSITRPDATPETPTKPSAAAPPPAKTDGILHVSTSVSPYVQMQMQSGNKSGEAQTTTLTLSGWRRLRVEAPTEQTQTGSTSPTVAATTASPTKTS